VTHDSLCVVSATTNDVSRLRRAINADTRREDTAIDGGPWRTRRREEERIEATPHPRLCTATRDYPKVMKALQSCTRWTGSAWLRRSPPRTNLPLFRGASSSVKDPPPPWKDLLHQVAAGRLSPDDALHQMSSAATTVESNAHVLESFATIDHTRQARTGFPEAVFSQGKTPPQVAAILDDMAQHAPAESTTAVLATRYECLTGVRR
jgi:hypothetical protein